MKFVRVSSAKVDPKKERGFRILKEAHDEGQGITASELAGKLGVAKRTALSKIKRWRDRKLVIVTGWAPCEGSGDHKPIYGVPNYTGQLDFPKPPPLQPKEKQARYRHRRASQRLDEAKTLNLKNQED